LGRHRVDFFPDIKLIPYEIMEGGFDDGDKGAIVHLEESESARYAHDCSDRDEREHDIVQKHVYDEGNACPASHVDELIQGKRPEYFVFDLDELGNLVSHRLYYTLFLHLRQNVSRYGSIFGLSEGVSTGAGFVGWLAGAIDAAGATTSIFWAVWPDEPERSRSMSGST